MAQAVNTKQAIQTVSDKGTLEALMANGNFQSSLKTVLPHHLTPERVVKMALVAASRQPLLYKCTQNSILQAIMKSAELGLDCSGTLGRAYLVPYFNSKLGAYECQFIPGYQGLIELARRSGNIARIESRVVYENDAFDVEYGLDQKLAHRPAIGVERGEMRCVYAVAELTDGSRQIEVMTMEEVEAIRNRSKAKDNGPWKTDYPEMSRKTVIRRLAKYLPLSTELAKAFEADDEQFTLNNTANDIAEATRRSVESLKDRLSVVKTEDTVVEHDESAIDVTAIDVVDTEPDAGSPQSEDIANTTGLDETPNTPATELTYPEARELVDNTIKEMKAADVKKILAGRDIDKLDTKQLLILLGELGK